LGRATMERGGVQPAFAEQPALSRNGAGLEPGVPKGRFADCFFCEFLDRTRAMIIGVPKEIKNGETRVSMTPSLARRCVEMGASVLVEKGAGVSAGFVDQEYRQVGASLAVTAKKVWASADLILKVKEPLESEYSLIREGQALFTYLHLAAGAELTKALLAKRALGIAYETVEAQDGTLPLLKPMSQIAGRLSTQIGAYFLQSQNGGSGVLLGGIPGTAPGHVVIIGAGNSGAHACRMATGMGARVTILDLDTRKLELIEEEYGGRVVTLLSNPANVESAVADADLLIGAVLIPAAKAPIVVKKATVAAMRPGSVIVDIAVDQGGCIETIKPTSHHEPVYKLHGVVHYAVPNMPALVGRTSTIGLTQATEPFLLILAAKGIQRGLEEHRGLSKGVNTRDGKLLNVAVAKALGYQ